MFIVEVFPKTIDEIIDTPEENYPLLNYMNPIFATELRSLTTKVG